MSFIPNQKLTTTAFSELLVSSPTPEVQLNAVYGLGSKTSQVTTGTGTAVTADSMFNVSTGTTTNSVASLTSKRSIVYRAGQGNMIRLTALFINSFDGCSSRAGLLNSTDEFSFGYSGLDFGIMHRSGGQQEIQELQVTTPAGGSESATVTIAGTGYTVPLTAGTVNHNAVELQDSLNAQVSGYTFLQVDDTVVARAVFSAPQGAFTFSSSSAIAAFTQVSAGLVAVEAFVDIADWNGGNDLTFFDPTKGNVYQVDYQWLGFGNARFWIESPDTGEFIIAHTVKYAGTATKPSLSNPTFRGGWVSTNRATTNDVMIKGSSLGLFIQGDKVFTEETRAASNSKPATSTGTLTNILTITVRETLEGKINIAPLLPQLMSIETDSTKSTEFRLLRNATQVTGEQDNQYISKSTSIVVIDTGVAEVSGGDVLESIVLGGAGSDRLGLVGMDIQILPGESLTLAAIISSGSASEVGGSLVWQEDI